MPESLNPLSSRSFGMRLACVLCVCAALVGLDLWQRSPQPDEPRGVWPVPADHMPTTALVPRAGGQIPMPANTPAAHASTLLPLPADNTASLLAFWFAGSRESGPDVQIAASAFDRSRQQWSAARFVVNRHEAGVQLGFGLRRLGNPVAWRDADGRIHLFVVATGLGGWAAGRILHLRQVDGGQNFEQLTFAPVRVLPLSWLWNTSHLVRAMPLSLADGGMVLPVYFELSKKYPVALRFDAHGGFRGMVRMSQRGYLLQPTLLMRNETDWLALLRDNSAEKKLRAVQTLDGGLHWQDAPDPGLHNPDAAIAALALEPGLMLLAHNPRPDSRAVLDLSISSDGRQWRRLLTLAQGEGPSEYSYPSLAWADGSLWVSYTDQRRTIAWQRLDPADKR
ncbi:MAG: sialidase family protein [Hylemonella sp.]|nr:sialidase family protein [Hylemonella sp.]MDP1937911.1 sialidase family protein [Hylemonella sp.]